VLFAIVVAGIETEYPGAHDVTAEHDAAPGATEYVVPAEHCVQVVPVPA
jgi:hypothetical protein